MADELRPMGAPGFVKPGLPVALLDRDSRHRVFVQRRRAAQLRELFVGIGWAAGSAALLLLALAGIWGLR